MPLVSDLEPVPSRFFAISFRMKEERRGEEAGEAMDVLHSTHLVAVDALVRIVCALKIPSAAIPDGTPSA